jgi:hypothetical protein
VVAALEIASGVTIAARRKNLFMLHPDPQIIPGAEGSPNFLTERLAVPEKMAGAGVISLFVMRRF